MRRLLRVLPLIVPVLMAAAATAQVATPTWETSIGPLFAAHCVACHSGPIGSAGLSLETYARAISGSRNGAVLIAGNPDDSLLMKRIRGQVPPRMPRDAPALAIDQIRMVGAWITAGMPER